MRLAYVPIVTMLAILAFGSGASAQGSGGYQRLVLLGGRAVEQAPSNVRLVFQLIEADAPPDTGLSGALRARTQPDPSIEAIVAELRKIFRFQRYELTSTSVLNLVAPGPAPDQNSSGEQHLTDDRGRPYDLDVHLMPADGDIRLHVSLSTRGNVEMPTGRGGTVGVMTRLISASVNLQTGKSIVLGSTRLDGSPGALILVVTATYDP